MTSEIFSHKKLATENKPFKITVASRKAVAQNIIDRNDFVFAFSPADVFQMNKVLDTDCYGFIRKLNVRFPKDPRHLHQLFEDGTSEAISWNKCITPLKPQQELARVFREAISCDTREFNEVFKPRECASCGSTQMLQTDHVCPPFSDIQKEFTDTYSEPKIEPREDGVGYRFADKDDEDRWYLFHAKRAIYQLLCLSCNASKGKRT
jgi:hypothetical protein